MTHSAASHSEEYCIGAKEAAQLLEITPARLSQLTSKGELSCIRKKSGARSKVFYKLSELVNYKNKVYPEKNDSHEQFLEDMEKKLSSNLKENISDEVFEKNKKKRLQIKTENTITKLKEPFYKCAKSFEKQKKQERKLEEIEKNLHKSEKILNFIKNKSFLIDAEYQSSQFNRKEENVHQNKKIEKNLKTLQENIKKIEEYIEKINNKFNTIENSINVIIKNIENIEKNLKNIQKKPNKKHKSLLK